jgi:hypothetical protein
MSSLFERVVGILFGPSAGRVDPADRSLVDGIIDVFVDTIEPRVRLASGYRGKLEANVLHTIAHLRALASAPLHPVVLTREAWSDDPFVRAAFASADDVPALIGRTEEIRRFFDEHAACEEAFALLGMERVERQVFAPHLEGEVIRNDVAQTVVSFAGHRLLAPAPDLAGARLAIGRLVLHRLAQDVLARVEALVAKAKALEEDKAMLGVRLRMLQRPGAAGDPQAISELERELEATSAACTGAKAGLATLDGYIDQMNAVLAHPEEHVALASQRLRVNRMGVKVEPGAAGEDDDLEVDLAEISIGEGLQASIKLVRIPRSELPPREDLLAQAEKLL